MKVRFWLFLLGGLGLPLLLSAQNFHLTTYDHRSGLPSNEVRHALRDSLGFLWIATDGGLVRTDGQDFEQYAHQLPSQYGRFLCPTPAGILLSHDAGISRIRAGIDSSTISLYQSASIDPDSPELFYPQSLHYTPQGQLWIAQANGQVALLQGGVLQRFALPGLESTRSQLHFAPRGAHLWIASSEGKLYRCALTGSPPELQATFPPIQALQAHDQHLWIGGEQLHRVQLDAEGNIRQRKNYSWASGAITALQVDSQGQVLVGIAGQGLHYLRLQGERVELNRVFANNDPHSVNELPFKNIHRIIVPSDRELWLCSAEGMGILRRRFFESVEGLPNSNTTAIAMTEDQGLYVNFGDLYIVERNELGLSGRSLSTATQGTITSLTTAGGQLWLGNSTGLLYRCNASGSVQRSWDFSQRGEGIFYLYPDSKRRLWFCQAPSDKPIQGIAALLPNGRLVEYGAEAGLDNRILVIRESSRGRLYAAGIGRSSYLYRYLPEEDAFLNLSLKLDFYVSPNFEVHDLSVDERGVIWLATTEGLLRHDLDRVRKIDLGPEFRDTEIRAVLALADGSIWLSSDTEGVLRYQSGETLALREESGLPSKVMAYRSLVVDAGGQLWIGSAEGVVYSLDPQPQLPPSPTPLIRCFLLDGQAQRSLPPYHYLDQSLSVEVRCPSFHGYRTFYQYRIDTMAWSTPTTEQRLYLPPLGAGQRTVAIRAQREGAFRWGPTREFTVEVRTRWYNQQSWWLAAVAVLGLTIGGLWIYRRRWLKRQIQLLRQQVLREQRVVENREAALVQAQRTIQQEQEEQRQRITVLDIVYQLLLKVGPAPKWEQLLEILSLELLRIPGVVAFELGTKRGQHLSFDGFAKATQQFTTDRVAYHPRTSLAAYCMQAKRPMIFKDLEADRRQHLKEPARRPNTYQSALAVPYFHRNEKAILLLYAQEGDHFDAFEVKAIRVFTAYLEQIT